MSTATTNIMSGQSAVGAHFSIRCGPAKAVLSEAIFLMQSEGASPDPILRMLERGILMLDFVLDDHRADVARLLRKYADRPMSLADACLVRMAELAEPCQVFTTDQGFLVYRRKGRHVIPLLAPFA